MRRKILALLSILGFVGSNVAAHPQGASADSKSKQRKAGQEQAAAANEGAHKTGQSTAASKDGSKYPPQGKAAQEHAATAAEADHKGGKSTTNSTSKYPIEHGIREPAATAANGDAQKKNAKQAAESKAAAAKANSAKQ